MPFISTFLELRTGLEAPGDVRIWETLSYLTYFSPELGKTYRAMIGTLTDGVSDGRLLQPLLSATGRAFWPAVIHDSGYEGTLEEMQENGTWGVAVLTKDEKDRMLREGCLSVGMTELEADAIYEAVSKAGMKAFIQDLSKPLPQVK